MLSEIRANVSDTTTRRSGVSTVLTPTKTWTAAEIETLVLELLADELGKDSDDLRAELEEKGASMPVDSLAVFDILVEFRQRTGLTIPKRKLARQTMRSVKTFSEFVAKEGRP
jgi:acyl carrier protein